MATFSAVTLGTFVATTILFALWLRWKKAPAPYPPGPPAYPLIGHLLALPKSYKEETFRDLARKYGNMIPHLKFVLYGNLSSQLGDIVYLNILGKSIVLLNSERVANDLLDQRSTIYSDRPSLPFFDMLVYPFSFPHLQCHDS